MRSLLLLIRKRLLKFRQVLYRSCFLFQPAVLCGNFICEKWPKFSVPVRCDGKGIVSLGKKIRFGYEFAPRLGNGEILLQARTETSRIVVGENTIFSNNVSVIANEEITIGSSCLIGDLCLIMDSDFHNIDPLTRRKGTGSSSPVVIGNNVWLGSRVVVQKGVRIGDNSVITPNAVVTKDIPPDSIAGGIPARVIRAI